MTTCNSCRFATFKNSKLWCNVHNQQTTKDESCPSHKPEDPPEELPPINAQFPGHWVRVPDQKACLDIIRQYCRDRHISRYTLGRKAGVSKIMVTYIMTKQRPLTTDTATKFFNAMGDKHE